MNQRSATIAMVFSMSLSAVTAACSDRTTSSAAASGASLSVVTVAPGKPGPAALASGSLHVAPSPVDTTPPEIAYPQAGIEPIAGSCREPWVVLASAPGSSDDKAAFPWVAQALLANPQFKITAEPHSGGEVAIEVHKKSDFMILARCHDAGNCTRLAAMYKAVDKSRAPQTGCGELPNGLSAATRIKSLTPALPEKSDSAGQCARIAACSEAAHPEGTDDVGAACVKDVKSFKLECASKPGCADVLACLK